MQGSVERATRVDAEDILRLRTAAEDWLEEHGIEQWGRGEVALAHVRREIQRGEWWLVRHSNGPCGALRLLWTDPAVWAAENRFAAYVHGLMVDRRWAGTGLGADLMKWVDEQARAAGAPAVRLDCVERNLDLRRYYRRHGFREVGRRDFDGPWFSAVLMEKRLA